MSVVTKGLDKLINQFDTLPRNIEKKVLRYALREGLKVFNAEVKKNVHGLDLPPHAKKLLKRSLKIRPMKTRDGSVKMGLVIKRGNRRMELNEDSYWWHWIEFGTAERYRALGWDSVDGQVSRKEVWDDRAKKFRRATRYKKIRAVAKAKAYTGRIKPQPFVRPAIESARDAASQAIAEAARRKFIELVNSL